ncbi:MarR family winged helix-turn-helix transcriptional regulator [Nocardia brasiliensis]|uniref:MarR family winged helix-turn-helix transcriptional regulator n=1 Tax=Nocardia brasiliensis TaxID=37326 RepID=UPI002458793A|nr:MarR family winged helix-turn-helix transcriptional regulator [Nocardia brasiliensis]
MEWLSDEEQVTWTAYVRMRQRLDAALAASLAKDGVSAADYELMVALSAAPGDCLRAKDLAAEVCWEKSRLSKHLARMDARGLVDRQPVAEDARGVLVQLTPAGRRLLERAAPNHVRLVREIFIDCVDPAEAEAIQALADKVVTAVEESSVGTRQAS